MDKNISKTNGFIDLFVNFTTAALCIAVSSLIIL